MRNVLSVLSGIWWSGIGILIALALVVFVFRVSKSKLSATSGVINSVSKATGVNI